MIIDSVPFAIGLLPPAAYLLMLGWIHLRGRPVVTSGYRDTIVLGLAISGLVVIGPMTLFFPHAAANRFGQIVWLLLMGLYAMALLLVSLSQRPRLLVLAGPRGAVLEQIRVAVAEVDPDARWLDTAAQLPGLQIAFEIQAPAGGGVVQLQANAQPQQLDGWVVLHRAVRRHVGPLPAARSPVAARFLSMGVALLAAVSYALFTHSESIWSQLAELLRV